MKLRSWYLHTIPVGLALAAGLVAFFKLPVTVRPRPRIAEHRMEQSAALPTPTAEPVCSPPPARRSDLTAVPPRTEAAPVVETGWIYTMVTDQAWSPESIARLRDLFLSPPTTEAWEMALWAVRTCPLPEATGWIDEFLRTNPSVRDRSDAILALSEKENAQSFLILQNQLASPEPMLSVAAAEAIARRSLWDPAARPLADSLCRDPRYSRFLPAWGEGE